MRNEGGLAIIYCQYNAFLLPYYVAEAETVERARIRINGIVQGVGFRPFIHRLVSKHGLNGMIRNNSSGVNTGYTDANGNFHQDALYKVKIKSITT